MIDILYMSRNLKVSTFNNFFSTQELHKTGNVVMLEEEEARTSGITFIASKKDKKRSPTLLEPQKSS